MADQRPGRTSEVLHDVGLAIGFGGSLMGAVGLRAARAATQTKYSRVEALATGWAVWSPVATAAALAYSVGSCLDWRARRDRMGTRPWLAEIALVALAASLTGYGIVAGSNVVADVDLPPADTGHDPAYAPSELRAVKSRLRVVQWLVPLCTGVALALSAGSRAGEVRAGHVRRTRWRAGSRAR